MSSKSSSHVDLAQSNASKAQTVKKSPQQQLEKAQNTCIELNEELNMLAYAISHDLEQPLRHIMAYTKLLSRKIETAEDKDIQKFAAFIQEAGLSLDGRINSILAFSRLSQREIQIGTVDTEQSIQEIFSRCKRGLKQENVDFQTQNLPVIQTDPHLFTLIFRELLKNSLYFTSLEKNPQIKVMLNEAKAGTVLTIQDNGMGMEGNKFERMVKLFQQGEHSLPKPPNSTGSGLSMVKRAVNMLEGQFSYSETADGMTCFHVRFP